MRSWRTIDEEQTRAVGRELAAELVPRGILLLEGELAAGKTVLVQGVAEALGFDRSRVRSPTYTIIHEHRSDSFALVHVDLYRLSPGEVAAAGVEEALASSEERRIVVVEWAERLPVEVDEAIRIRISVDDGGEREIVELDGTGSV